MDLNLARYELVQSKPYFKNLSPTWPGLIRGRMARWARRAFVANMAVKETLAFREGKPAAEIVGNIAGGQINRRIFKQPRKQMTKAHLHARHIQGRDFFRKNGLGGHYWFYQPGRHQMVIVFHDAYKAGPHLDVHIGRFSMVRRVKPEVYEQIRYNNQGYLTQDSKQLLLDFLREEVDNNTRIPQNLDHSITNTKATWLASDVKPTRPDRQELVAPTLMPWVPERIRDTDWFQQVEKRRAPGYGAGDTRQVVFEDTVDIYKAHHEGPFEFYAPKFNFHRGMYVYRLYPGNETRAPILVWGNLTHDPPNLEDRLHLRFIQPEDMEKMLARSDPDTSTAKYDGSSCYVVITPKGTTVWSPRESKATGKQIEYTYMLKSLPNVTSPETIVGMGELMFHKRTPPWVLAERKEFLPQATGGGLLNGQTILPKGINPEIYLYRIDRIGRTKTIDLPFWDNRELQEEVAKLDPKHLKVVELMSPEKAHLEGFEGVVMGRSDEPVTQFNKTKWTTDPNDWVIDEVQYHEGPRGGVAGVTWATSLESGRRFKLGPGQMGDQRLTRHMAEHPDLYKGVVLQVASRIGHEGRAANVVGFHQDKGVAPPELPAPE